MGPAIHCITLLIAVGCLAGASQSSEDVELNDPYIVELAKSAAKYVSDNAEDLGVNNKSSLNRIMDVHIVPASQPTPAQYMLNLEMGVDCNGEGSCSGSRQICEVTVLDEPWAKKQMIEEEKTICADRELNGPLEFIDTSSTIATSLPLDSAATKAIALKAISQVAEKRGGGKHTLKYMGKVRKVKMEESNSNLYYLTMYISTSNDDVASEVCEVTMEEALSNLEQTLQSMRCFATGDNEAADKFGLVRVPADELTSALINHAVLASLAIIDAESTSAFQLKVIGYSLVDSRMSVDSGARDLQLKLGIVPTLCIKRADSEDDDDSKSCAIDVERGPSMCAITLTQWPWVTDGYLFSDFSCKPTTYPIINEELVAITDDDSSSAGEDGGEVEEVTSNAVQNGNRRENTEEEDEEEEEESEFEEEADEEAFVARTGPCNGCPSEMNVRSPEVKEMAAFVLNALEGSANSNKVQNVARIVKATSQVVSGILYELTIELVETNCARSANVDRSKCVADATNGVRRVCNVKIWERSWLNSKEIRDPSCGAAGVGLESRSLKTVSVSGARESMTLSPDDEDAKNAANFALSRLDSFDDNSRKRLLVKIMEASSDSVARSKTYKLKMQVVLADCPESSDANDPACQATAARSASFLCDVQVLAQAQLGAEAKFTPRRLVDSKCFPAVDKSQSDQADAEKKDLLAEGSENSRAPVQQLSAPQRVGGTVASDKDSPYIRSIAQFATSAINERSNGNNLQLVRVVRADTQVVAGKKVILDVEVGFTNCTKSNAAGNCYVDDKQEKVLCRVTVWDRPWLNDRRVTNLTCNSQSLSFRPPSEDNAASSSPDSSAPFIDEDVMSAEIESYADFALAVVEEQSNANAKLKVVRILVSSLQVAEGKNVRLTLEVAPTKCTKDQPIADDCPVDESKEKQICNIQIWDKPELHEKQVTDLNCQLKRKKLPGRARSEDFDESPFPGDTPQTWRLGGKPILPKKSRLRAPAATTQRQLPVLGGYSAADTSDADVQEIAKFATVEISKQYQANSNGSNAAFTLVKIHSAEKQVVAGVNYRLELEVSRNDGSYLCRVVVFDQVWTSTRNVTSIKCFPQALPPVASVGEVVQVRSQRTRQSKSNMKPFSSPFRPAYPDSDFVQDMAAFAVAELNASGDTFSLVKVTSAAKQATSDKIDYKLALKLLRGQTTVSCDVVVSYPTAAGSVRRMSSSSCASPNKKPAHSIGGYTPVDVSDKAVNEMAAFATVAIGQAANDAALSLFKIISASRQLVSGMNYKLTIQLNGPNGIQTCGVVVYDQSWTNTRKLSSFECKDSSGARVSRQLIKSRRPIIPNNSELSRDPPPHCSPGGYCPIDPREKSVQEMASFATLSLSRSSNSGPLTLVKVRSAARQVVAGFNYKLVLDFMGADEALVCNVIVFDQAWTSTRQVSNSECMRKPLPTTTSTSPAPTTPAAAVAPAEPATPEVVNPVPASTDIYLAVNTEEPDVRDSALLATSLLKQLRNAAELELVRISSASKQVGGSNYKLNLEIGDAQQILSCLVVVHFGPNTRQMIYSSCAPQSRQKRSNSDRPTEEKIKELSDFAVSAIALRSNEPSTPSSIRVMKALQESQSDGVISYTMDLQLVFVHCSQDPESCSRHQRCSVSIREQSDKLQLSELNCKDNTKIRPIRLGGVAPINPSSEEAQKTAALALQEIQARSNSPNPLTLIRIKSATRQIVSGKKIALTLEVGDTKSAERQLCKVSIWTRPWLNESQVTDLKCVPIAVRRSRRDAGELFPRKSHHNHRQHRKLKNNDKKARRLKHMSAFRSYLTKFDKVYKTWDEFEKRYKIYRANQEKIALLNKHEMGTAEYGDTPFSDWSEAEYKQHLAGFRPLLRRSEDRLPKAVIPQIDIPDAFDWRNFNVVTPVKNQGSCGSCWAFSVTGNVEGVYGVQHKQLISLSEQELVDCDKLDSGCNGGLPENAYKAIQEIGGLEVESDYPYNGHQNNCKYNSSMSRVQVTGGVEISTNEIEMAKWLVQNGPISIGINANAMQFYRGGVSHPWKFLCRPGGIDHGVLIVGYGESDYPKFNKTLPYWIVKNSWGTSWGEQGYYRVFRGDGTCGLNQMATSAVVA